MIHPVKTPLGAVRAVTHLSFTAVRHPIRTVGDVTTFGRGLVASVVTGDSHDHAVPDVATGGPLAQPAPPERGSRKIQGDALSTQTRSTEPSGVTAIGDEDEIPSGAVPYEEYDVEVTTPVGTTGAGVGYNPHTGETDLQQPGTEPLMDPSTTKRIKAETDVLRKASDPRKD
ncbi:hypothetical protein JCM18899A_41650 [Nocardioides sp. AN3]